MKTNLLIREKMTKEDNIENTNQEGTDPTSNKRDNYLYWIRFGFDLCRA